MGSSGVIMLVRFNIRDFNGMSFIQLFVWIVSTYIFNYVSFVKHKFKTAKFGNLVSTCCSVFTGLIFAYVTMHGDYEILDQDLNTVQDIIRFQLDKEKEL